MQPVTKKKDRKPSGNDLLNNMDYVKISDQFIGTIGNSSYLAILGMIMAISCATEKSETECSDAERKKYEDILRETGTDYSNGLIASYQVSTLIKTFGLNRGGRMYDQIENIFKGADAESQWTVLCSDDEKYAVTKIITGAMYFIPEKKIYIKFNADLKNRILQVKTDYINVPLRILGKLHNDYTINLYMILKQGYKRGQNKEHGYRKTENEEVKVTIPIDHLMFNLNIYPVDFADIRSKKTIELLKKNYFSAAAMIMKQSEAINRIKNKDKKWAVIKPGMMRTKILDTAFKLINGFEMVKGLEKESSPSHCEAKKIYEDACKSDNPTDIHFRYTFDRGAKGKIENVNFFVSESAAEKDSKPKTKEETSVKKSRKKLQTYPPEIISRCAQLLEGKIEDEKTIDMLLKKADGNMSIIEDAIKAVDQQLEKKDVPFVPYMVKAVEGRWKPNVVSKTKNAFNNFPQRHYSDEYYEELERKKLGF